MIKNSFTTFTLCVDVSINIVFTCRFDLHLTQIHTKMGLDPFIAFYVEFNANTKVSVNNFKRPLRAIILITQITHFMT